MKMKKALLGMVCASVIMVGSYSAHALDNPLARNKAYVGTFTGEGIKLVLSMDGDKNTYVGTLTIDGKDYPCTGDVKDGAFAGKFTVGGQSYDFTAAQGNDGITLTSDGAKHTLKKADAPANPLLNNNKKDAPAPNPIPTPPPAKPEMGGVGIAFEPTQNGLMLRAIMPGSPADKAKLKPEGKLVAIDGKSVEGLTLEQVREKIMGQVGTPIKLTVETDTEVMDVMLNRATLPQPGGGGNTPQPNPQQGPGPVPNPGPFAGPGPGGNANIPVNAPAILKPGTVLMFWVGSSTNKGVVGGQLNDNNPGGGGYGFAELTVMEIADKAVLINTRTFTVIDPQNGFPMFMNSQAGVESTDKLGEYWINPARLAAEKEWDQNGVSVKRLQYPLNNKNYNTICFETKTDRGYTRGTYDLETGLLLASTSSVAQAGQQPGPLAAGVNAQTIFVGSREMKLPWTNDALPNWVANGAKFVYTGSYITRVPGIPDMPPYRITGDISIVQPVGKSFVAKLLSSLDTNNGAPPQQSQSVIGISSHSIGTIFINPQILQQLQPNQVLDQDEVLKRRVFFAGAQGQFATVVDQGQLDSRAYTYNLQSGQLVGIQTQSKTGLGVTEVNMQLVPARK